MKGSTKILLSLFGAVMVGAVAVPLVSTLSNQPESVEEQKVAKEEVEETDSSADEEEDLEKDSPDKWGDMYREDTEEYDIISSSGFTTLNNMFKMQLEGDLARFEGVEGTRTFYMPMVVDTVQVYEHETDTEVYRAYKLMYLNKAHEKMHNAYFYMYHSKQKGMSWEEFEGYYHNDMKVFRDDAINGIITTDRVGGNVDSLSKLPGGRGSFAYNQDSLTKIYTSADGVGYTFSGSMDTTDYIEGVDAVVEYSSIAGIDRDGAVHELMFISDQGWGTAEYVAKLMYGNRNASVYSHEDGKIYY